MLGPTLLALPFTTALWGGVGYAYGKMANVSPQLSAKVLAISEIAGNILFIIGASPAKTKRDILATFALTSLITNAVTTYALLRLNLVSTKGALVLSGLTILTFLARAAQAADDS